MLGSDEGFKWLLQLLLLLLELLQLLKVDVGLGGGVLQLGHEPMQLLLRNRELLRLGIEGLL